MVRVPANLPHQRRIVSYETTPALELLDLAERQTRRSSHRSADVTVPPEGTAHG
jgi:hypothetical protein